MMQIKRIRRQGKSKNPNTNGGNLLRRPSASNKKSLGKVVFGIIYISSAKSRSARGASHQPAFMDSCLTISHARLARLSSDQLVLGVL